MSEKRRKIFMVDDVNYVLLSQKNLLKDDYEVYPIQNEESLFELLEKVTPELILLDIQMPDSNGFEVITNLKKDPRYADIPVIFLSGNKTDRDSIVKGMSLGAVDFITKPITKNKLIESIESQLDPVKWEANKPVILAVDDNPSILHAINDLLHDDYSVYTLTHPQAIKDILNKLTPDLFILDCQMPVLHGFELVPIIRGYPEHEDTPIVFLTAEGSVDHVSVATTLGARDFIVKPIDEKVLRDRVALHLADYITRRRVRSIQSKEKY